VIRPFAARLRRDESGVTLAEVIVVFLLSVVVLSTVGGIYISTIRVQQVVGAMTGTTTQGQLVANSLDRGIRNASAFQITTLPSGDQVVRARSLDGSTSGLWVCMAWYYVKADGGSIRSIRGADGQVIAVPTSSALANWSLLASGVKPSAGATVFSTDPATTTVLAVDFTTTGKDSTSSARIKFSTPLMPGTSLGGTCF
jgi:Tfp pilus assembly protein PilW